MKILAVLILLSGLTLTLNASWYWPFGGSKKQDRPRISELMEPASLLIDTAADYAEQGKTSDAVAEYKKVLAELDRIELENPERAKTPEFATLRNKRAYVNSTIDALLLKEAQNNAKAVAVTDTTELERKFARLKAEKEAAKAPVKDPKEAERETEDAEVARAAAKDRGGDAVAEAAPAKDPKSRRARLMQVVSDMRAKDYDAAKLTIAALLAETPNDAAALNLRAAVESELGDERAAEKTLDRAITSNPRSHYAYYNMAKLFLRTRGAEGRDAARRYYKTGRGYGGPADPELEKAFE